MVKCPGCGGLVSEWAAQCQHCSASTGDAPALDEAEPDRPPFARGRRGVLASVVAGTVVVAVVAYLISSRDWVPVGTDDDAANRPGITTGTLSPLQPGPRRGTLAYRDEARNLRIVDLGEGGEGITGGPVEAYPTPVVVATTVFVVIDAGQAFAVTVRNGGATRKRLGAAEEVVPSQEPGAVWLVRGEPAFGSEAHLVGVDGRPRGTAIQLPQGVRLAASAGAHLVLQRAKDRVLELYDLDRLQLTPLLALPGEVVDARGSVLAWLAHG